MKMMINRQLSFMKACDMGNSLIAVDELGKGIFQIDKRDMSSKLLAMIERVKNKPNIYQAAERYCDEVFFFPINMNQENNVIIYHLNDQSIEYLDLMDLNDTVSGDYRPIYKMENSVWMFPTDLNRDLIRFQLDTRQVEVIPEWKHAVKDIKLEYTDSYSKLQSIIEIQDKVYHTIKKSKYIVEINKTDFQVKLHTLQIDVNLYCHIDFDGEKLWIAAGENQGVVSWNPVTYEVQYYPIMLTGNDIWIDYILCGTDYLWLVPKCDDKMIRMNYKTGEYEPIDIFSHKFCVRKGKKRAFGMVIRNGDIADLYPVYSNIVIHLDLKKDELLEHYEEILLPNEWSEADIVNYQAQYQYETNRVSPDVFVNSFIENITKVNAKIGNCNQSNGENIWQQIKKTNR